MRYSLVALGSLALTAAVPSPSGYSVHEKRSHVPSALWARRNEVPSDMLLPMRIGLKQRNLDRAYDLLMDVSSHDSPNYGKHYTADEVTDLFAPEHETVESVRSWLVNAGISPHKISQSTNKAWIQFDATAAEAEALLKTKYHFWEHDSGDANVACDEYHLPSHVQGHVDYITPGIRLLTTGKGSPPIKGAGLKKRGFGSPPVSPKTRPLPQGLSNSPVIASSLAVCDQIATPACIATLYNITQATKATKGNELGIYEYGDVYSANDLNLFFGLFADNIPNGTHPTLDSVDGGLAPAEAANTYGGDESALDFQITYPIIYPQNSILFQTDDPYYTGYESKIDYTGLFNNFLDAVDGSYCTYSAFNETGNDPNEDPPYPDPNTNGYKGKLECGVYKPTNVVSVSYGENEYDLPLSYQQRQCNEWMKLGLQGTSVIFASGDSGVGGRYGEGGHDSGCLGSNGTVFNPDYPATCPYITTAGATFLPRGANVSRDEEVAVQSFQSGGGFSNIYPRPSYQNTSVLNYFNKYAPAFVTALPYYSTSQNKSVGANGGVYNRAGRGYPDVSAVGDNVLVVVGGEPQLIGGTSAASPAFAAIITRINEERLAAGKKIVGFLNPTLYAHPEAFHDITSGNNTYCKGKGFVASKGWDPVTGLGTPNYPSLLKVFLSLP